VDQGWSDGLRTELRWLGALLGRVRDADVLLARLQDRTQDLGPTAKAAKPILRSLRAERARAFDELLAVLGGERYLELLERLVVAAGSPQLMPRALERAKDVAPELVRGPCDSLEQAVEALGKDPSDEELHAVRIRAKRCRYATEAAAPVLGKRAARFARAAADLQQVLGDLNDAVVAERWLRDWVTGRRSSEAVFAAGELAGLERAAASASRAKWRGVMKSVLAARPRSLS
jgi:CHAD domain-containing protein